MRQSALWSPFFFVGLLFACGRIAEWRAAPSPAAATTHAVVTLHHVKIAIDGRDSLGRPGASERAFAEPATALPGEPR